MLHRIMLGRKWSETFVKKTCLEDCAEFAHIHTLDRQSALMLKCAACMKKRITRKEREDASILKRCPNQPLSMPSCALRTGPPCTNKNPRSPHGPSDSMSEICPLCLRVSWSPTHNGSKRLCNKWSPRHEIGVRMLGTRHEGSYSRLDGTIGLACSGSQSFSLTITRTEFANIHAASAAVRAMTS